MILTLTDGQETVFLTLSLHAIEEDKPVSEILGQFVSRERVPELLEQIRKFARSKLSHPILKLALEEMNQLMTCYQEKQK